MSVPDPHSQTRREGPEPAADAAPAPPWFVVAVGVIAFWAFGYLLSFGGGFGGGVQAEDPADADPLVLGKKVFTVYCAICHQPDGRGLPGQYPPLAGSEIVLGRGGFGPNHLAGIVLGGLYEPVTVRGAGYNGTMAPWGDVLTDGQAAAVLTYIRQAWGNDAGPVSKEEIAAFRATVAGRSGPWTIAELRKVPAGPLEPLAPLAPPPEFLKVRAK